MIRDVTNVLEFVKAINDWHNFSVINFLNLSSLEK